VLRSRYQKNILSTFLGQVLVHINPLRVGMNIEEGGGAGAEGDAILEKFALDVKNHATMAPEMWNKALACMKAKERRPSLDGQFAAPGVAGGLLALLKEAHGSEEKR
jgi:hypothetical protein